MKYKAHDYQQYAAEFILEHPVSCLILDMGLGKTVITLTALWNLLFDYFAVGSILVIAPKRVAENTWPEGRHLHHQPRKCGVAFGTGNAL